ncbi:hypothetical protein TGAMA5MH_06935 [Trichoderma gamsii]|uniref:Uncharacterized protein n=1 Tax=Trichoderma gamsii TaxID=398673 RepID=A0A2K0T6B9_9HYPO|nr:hypothetical protein TGAMA5MH_06935 [Trichoderma gamsii]
MLLQELSFPKHPRGSGESAKSKSDGCPSLAQRSPWATLPFKIFSEETWKS